jgi:hypothetical protein
MGLKTIIVLDHQKNEGAEDLKRLLISDNRVTSGIKLEDVFRQITSGVRSAKCVLGTNAVQASGTVTLSSHVATNTVTINGVVFTAVASGATGNQYNVGTDTVTAANLAAAINASVSAAVAGLVTATSSGAVVTVTAVTPGLLGNLVTLAISANGSVSGANATGGTQGTNVTTNYYGSSV